MVDRDMFMRYRGGGIGHQLPRDATELTEKDDGWEDTPDDEDTEVPENDPELRQDIRENDEIEGGDTEVIEKDLELRQDDDDEEIEEERDSDEEVDYGYKSAGEAEEEEEEEEEAGEDECEDEGLGAEDGEDPSDLNDDDEYDTL
jgi:hypothetical protein